MIELTNPGASGSIFYVTRDDEFIIKTVLHKEAEFLQKLLPGYYMVRPLSTLCFVVKTYLVMLLTLPHLSSSLVHYNKNSLKYKPDKHIFLVQILENLSSAELASLLV